jgi:hypothetical protein
MGPVLIETAAFPPTFAGTFGDFIQETGKKEKQHP